MAGFDTSSAPIDPGTIDSSLLLASPGQGGFAPLPAGTPTPASFGGADTLYASMGLSAIGAITTGLEQSAATRAQSAYESTVANVNAEIAGVKAAQTLETGDIMASRENLKTQGAVGAAKAAQGTSGIDVASGSAALVRAGLTGVGRSDELTIRNNAARQAWGYQTEAIGDIYKGQFMQLTGQAQSTQSLLTAGLGAVSGPLSIESNYLRWSRYLGGGSGGSTVPFPNMVNG